MADEDEYSSQINIYTDMCILFNEHPASFIPSIKKCWLSLSARISTTALKSVG